MNTAASKNPKTKQKKINVEHNCVKKVFNSDHQVLIVDSGIVTILCDTGFLEGFSACDETVFGCTVMAPTVPSFLYQEY